MTSMTQLNSHEILINIRRSLCRALVVSKEFSHCDWATKTGIMFKELAMQALIINFNLDGITRSDYEGLCTELAPVKPFGKEHHRSRHRLRTKKSLPYGS